MVWKMNGGGPAIMEPCSLEISTCSTSGKMMMLDDSEDNNAVMPRTKGGNGDGKNERLNNRAHLDSGAPSLENRLISLNIQADDDDYLNHNGTGIYKSFLLLDGSEKLRVQTVDEFCAKLQSLGRTNAKVVSIFGNTGDGKSHTMNNAFFKGEEVFKMSADQDSCTMGVWAAMQSSAGILCLDTEGLLGITTTENQRTRMLLKVLAISDVIIYRTRSERLHSDMFSFLGMASKAFCQHFSIALQSLNLATTSKSLGPALIIFHETRNTKVIQSTLNSSPEDILRDRFTQLNMNMDAFSSIKYIGIQSTQSTNYSTLKSAVKLEIENKTVRSARQLSIIFEALKSLNAKFSGQIHDRPLNPFPEQYFTCNAHCESCGDRCERSMGHLSEGKEHKISKRCRHQQQFENKIFLCKRCLLNGQEIPVTVKSMSDNETSWVGFAKLAWSGSVIECRTCGPIYRSRQHWYGNRNPEDYAVQSEIVHVWKGVNMFNKTTQTHSARMLLDGVSYLAETVGSIGAQPTKVLTNWATDKIAPDYWIPNAQIIFCRACKVNFEQKGLSKHHCRACGEGFCSGCSNNYVPVPSRGWPNPVRVCNACKSATTCDQSTGNVPQQNGEASRVVNNVDPNVCARKVGEVLINTLSSAASLLEYPKDLIVDSTRPSYWISDADAKDCAICNLVFNASIEFNPTISLHDSTEPVDIRRHHCRACGRAVCNACSKGRRPVPERNWFSDVRVCDACINNSN